MQNLNYVTLIGRVGTEPEGREVNGTTVCQFRMATNRAWVDQSGQKKEVATWHRIVCWNKQAETCQQYVHKGMMVFVTGSLETREYEKDGEKRSITEIRAQQVGFLSRPGEGQAEATERAPQPQSRASAPQRQQPYNNGGYSNNRPAHGGHQASMEDVPF